MLNLVNKWGDTKLHQAAEKGNHDEVMMMATKCPELLRSAKNVFGHTPLSLLCYGKHDKTIIEALKLAATTTTDAPAAVISIDHHHHQVYTESVVDQAWFLLQDVQTCLDKLDQGELVLSPNMNTVLHIASKSGDIENVSQILKKHPSLLSKRNLQGETPAYVAASEGHMDVVETIISYIKINKYEESNMKELMTRSTDKDTALLAAIRNHYAGVVFSLTKEVPILASCVNNSEVSPIYLAVEKGYGAIVKHILETCEEATFQGPQGKTAVHASALSGSPDAHGWTPLHYAAYFDHQEAAEALVTKDRSTGYHFNDKHETAIHIASSQGHILMICIIMEECHGCWEITDSKGRNILHIAVEKQRKEIIDDILRNEKLTSLINQKDNDGNTPLHLLAASDFEMKGALALIKDTRVDIHALNNEKRTPLDMASSVDRKERLFQLVIVKSTRTEEDFDHQPSFAKVESSTQEKSYKLIENLIIVATLVATASFTTAFAIPGGYDGKLGIPILLRKPSFQAFAFTNGLAFSSSCCAIFLYFHVLRKRIEQTQDEDTLGTLIGAMYCLVGIAVVAMNVAFITGLYVVLEPSLGLAIPLCLVSLSVPLPSLLFPNMFSEYVLNIVDYVIKRFSD